MAATQWFVFLLHTTRHCKNWWRLGFHHFFSIRICQADKFSQHISNQMIFNSMCFLRFLSLAIIYTFYPSMSCLFAAWHRKTIEHALTPKANFGNKALNRFVEKISLHSVFVLPFCSVLSCCILLWVTCFDQRCQRLARRRNSTWHVQWTYLMVSRMAKQRKRHGQVVIFSVVRFWHFDFALKQDKDEEEEPELFVGDCVRCVVALAEKCLRKLS